jgi:D-glycero-D-manno-heptose 1,7-bisphosphate phosphatase
MSRIDSVGRPAVFLDRDGTINEEKNYLHRIEDFQFISGAPEAIKALNQAGYLVLVITNQSGVARGYFSLEDVEALHQHLAQCLAAVDAHVDGFYVCPHHPTAGEGELRRVCSCRKGEPGLLLQAAREHGIDLSKSFMIGDKEADIEAGENAGCTSLLVLTGYGKQTAQSLASQRAKVFTDLKQAADYICRQPA